jgi:L-2-hydroxycarboxylate dehydrogenase (NAD+)
MKISTAKLEQLSYNILKACNVPQDDAQIIVNSILYAHTRGKGTHGVGRMPIYVRKIKEGLMSAETQLSIVKDSPVVSVYDANHGFGQVAAHKGMEYALDKADKHGVGVVGINNSNSFGTAGFILELAYERQMIGLLFSNASPAIAPSGGNKPLFGTNPIGYVFPNRKGEPPIVLDMATSVAARSKIRMAAANGETIPFGWALDSNGKPTTDPIEALKGSMLAIGDHKGYGLSLAVDILAGLLTGAAFGGDVKPLNHKDNHSNYGHLIIALNIGFFMSINDYYEKIDYLIRNTKKCGEPGKVFLPGEQSFNKAKNSLNEITLSAKQVEDINKLLGSLQINEKL